MAVWRVYIKPFDDAGNYGTYTEVTDYVNRETFSSITEKLDNSEYNVGIFRFSNLSLSVNNFEGKFSDVGGSATIFRYRRAGSMVKVTYQQDNPAICGIAIWDDAVVSEEIKIYEGLLVDETATTNVVAQKLSFKVLGLESVISEAIVPYSSISNGDLLSAVIYTCLNQASITKVLTVDAGNITCGTDVTIDDKTSLETKTVKEAFDELMLLSNSVLYIKDATIYVAPRAAGVTVEKTFYGQSAVDGLEDILNISDIKTGLNKTFNYLTWSDSTTVSSDTDSIALNGYKKQEISSEIITNAGKQTTVLDGIKGEFKDPKREFKLKVVLNEETLALEFLNRVAIDYPAIAIAGEFDVPTYGFAVYGVSGYPISYFNFTFDPTDDNWKIMGRTIDMNNFTIEFDLREI